MKERDAKPWYERARQNRLVLSLSPQIRWEARTILYRHLVAAIKLGVPLTDSLLAFGLDQDTWFRRRNRPEQLYDELRVPYLRRRVAMILAPAVAVLYPLVISWLSIIGVYHHAPMDQARALARSLSLSLLKGLSLSESLAREPLDFPPEDIAMIALAEKQGNLADVMGALAGSSGRSQYAPSLGWRLMRPRVIKILVLLSFITIFIQPKFVDISNQLSETIPFHTSMDFSVPAALILSFSALILIGKLTRTFQHGYLLGQILYVLTPGYLLYLVLEMFTFRDRSNEPWGFVVPLTTICVLVLMRLRRVLLRPSVIPSLEGVSVPDSLVDLFSSRRPRELRIMELLGVAAKLGMPEHDSLRLLAQCYPAPLREPLVIAAEKVATGMELGRAMAEARVLTGDRARVARAMVAGPDFGRRLCEVAHDLQRMADAEAKRWDRVMRPVTVLVMGGLVYLTIKPILEFLSTISSLGANV